jgi:hypothetical protein
MAVWLNEAGTQILVEFRLDYVLHKPPGCSLTKFTCAFFAIVMPDGKSGIWR